MTKKPKILDDYELVEELGSGAFATVHKARPVGLKNTFVALKVAKEGQKERLKAEAEVYDQLHHPHIVNIARVKDDYIAMDYMPKTLRDVLDEKRAGLNKNKVGIYHENALNIALQVASALEHVHEKGLVHKDIKPEAILLDGDFVKISDFNLSKIIEAEESHSLKDSLVSTTDPKLSLWGGTIGYMSPEQENQEPVDEKSDSWSLGVVLYEMLTGNRPSGNYPKPSEVDRHIPKWVDDLVDSCLIPDAADRYQSTSIRTHIEDGLAGKLDPATAKKQKESRWQKFISYFPSKKTTKTVAWNITKYTALSTVLLPLWIPFAFAKDAKQCPKGSKEFKENMSASIGCGVIFGIIGYILAPAISIPVYCNYQADEKIKLELQSETLTGKIAYFDDHRIAVLDAKSVTDKNREENRLFPKTDIISSVLWAEDGKSLYFIGKECEEKSKDGKIQYATHLYNITLDSVQTVIADLFEIGLDRSSICGIGSIDDKKVIFVEQNRKVSAVDFKGNRISNAFNFSPKMLRSQQHSLNGRFKLRYDGTNAEIEYADGGIADFDIAKAKGAVWYHAEKEKK